MLISAPNLSLIPGIEVIAFGVCFVFPCIKTLQLLYGPSAKVGAGSSGSASLVLTSKYIQWTAFWLIYALVYFLEDWALYLVIPFIPLYLEIKSVLFFWLVHEEFLGAGWIWFHFLDSTYFNVDNVLIKKYDTMVPPPIKKLLEGSKPAATKAQ